MKKNIITLLVILDRDNVINENSYQYIKSPSNFKTILVSVEAMKMLIAKRILLAIANNQSGIGRVFFNYTTVCKIHQNYLTS